MIRKLILCADFSGCITTCTLQKGDLDDQLNLAKVISVSAESHHVTPTLSSYFSYTFETEGMWAMCRVSSTNM